MEQDRLRRLERKKNEVWRKEREREGKKLEKEAIVSEGKEEKEGKKVMEKETF
jgi:hypothetical protein